MNERLKGALIYAALYLGPMIGLLLLLKYGMQGTPGGKALLAVLAFIPVLNFIALGVLTMMHVLMGIIIVIAAAVHWVS